ncbi:MAG TPA: hypothetical protein VJN43_07215 [Bryobacteraceae bacterium]|nr:hypothetical protein [Bryobacteraceae bacterium]
MVKPILISLAAVLLAFATVACNRDPQEAVRQGVIDYLSKRSNINLSGMNIAVTSVVFRQNEADAVVSFTAKGANPGQPMTMRYTLERHGQNWVVKNREEKGGNPHGGDMTAPPASTQPGAPLPPGHPAVNPSPAKP